MKILVISTMFPNKEQPSFGIFVYQRISHIQNLCQVTVIAPVPWFPFATLLDRYAHRKKIPLEDTVGNLHVEYVRFLSVPKFLKSLDGFFMGLAITIHILRKKMMSHFDLIDAHLGYPDGFGAYIVSLFLGKPFIITLRGHDINNTPNYRVRKKLIQLTLRKAAYVISVADALRKEAVRLKCPEENTETIPNGVDKSLFYPVSKHEARDKLNLPLDKKILLSVGYLVERKGVHITVEALGILKQQGDSDIQLLLIGDSGEEGNYKPVIVDTINRLNLNEQVHFLGNIPNDTLRYYYSAADLLCLSSSKEGRANVLLESLACGTPVVATNIWGTPEIITSDELGILVERNPESIAKGIQEGLAKNWDSEVIVQSMKKYTWEDVAETVVERYKKTIGTGSVVGDRKLQVG
jgi:teichuronic acid biosynthesis glycosyltransferase TuaC